MNKIRYWLLLKMAESPRFFAFGIGPSLLQALLAQADALHVRCKALRISEATSEGVLAGQGIDSPRVRDQSNKTLVSGAIAF